MSMVVFDISMSLDRFITASNRRPDEPMGDGGQRLHEWAFGNPHAIPPRDVTKAPGLRVTPRRRIGGSHRVRTR
jgi:hypothetical protein